MSSCRNTVGKLNTQPVNAGDPLNPSTDPGATFERRPFFVEGSGTFRFNMDCNDSNCTGLFYSRRIGRAPQG